MPNTDSYERRIDGGAPIPATKGEYVDGLGANTVYGVELRALNAAGPSDWSVVKRFVTRPPRPPAPDRIPYDFAGWGIVLAWDVDPDFNDSQYSHVRLQRSISGGPEERLFEGALTDGHADLNDPEQSPKQYWLKVAVPDGAIPDVSLIGDKESDPGPPIDAQYPFFVGSIPPRLVPGQASQLTAHYRPYGDPYSVFLE